MPKQTKEIASIELFKDFFEVDRRGGRAKRQEYIDAQFGKKYQQGTSVVIPWEEIERMHRPEVKEREGFGPTDTATGFARNVEKDGLGKIHYRSML